ncbi:MAG TPA: hypothetical protein VFL14_00740 [Xanthomonadales bacterium]|nr:hypothetical protein [Xanthomonadales bacterium]
MDASGLAAVPAGAATGGWRRVRRLGLPALAFGVLALALARFVEPLEAVAMALLLVNLTVVVRVARNGALDTQDG